ncbi:hypothetical protein [Saccharothrix texasensis]|uniref:Uncharacterized protein n=1 Tax=Saccharothrix texasensis TaxID=103734 RepID=A0A3N1HJB7_9PSEU|nr:hypothetical protein [Saccharothrix texasensis]ROP42525.1 hypothetical protein EDD40_8029 [Saccharothrix texasensis]
MTPRSAAQEAPAQEAVSRAVGRRATALAGLSSIADVAAVAQLVTTGSDAGVLVAGLLSVLAGFLGLIQLTGRPVGLSALAMALLIAIAAGMTGAAVHGYWTGAGTAAGPGRGATSTTTTPSGSPTTTPSGSTAAGSVTAVAPGAVVRTGTTSLRDQDYLDVETGRIGEVEPGASDLWYVGGYRELWTSGGGKLPITPVATPPDAAACADELARRSYDQVAIGPLDPGAWLCARTAEENLVAVQVTAIPTGDEPLVITYTVWHK